MVEEDLEKKKQVDYSEKVEMRKAEFLAVGEACNSVIWLTPDFKENCGTLYAVHSTSFFPNPLSSFYLRYVWITQSPVWTHGIKQVTLLVVKSDRCIGSRLDSPRTVNRL